MPATLTATASIDLPQPPSKVWEALTRPDLVKQWMFGADVVSNWKAGGTVLYRGVWDGTPFEDRGEITEIDPPRVLKMNFYSASSGLPDLPENRQPITYALAPHAGGTRLTVTHENNTDAAAATASEGNWKMTLGMLKTVLASA